MKEQREKVIREIEKIGAYITSDDLFRILKAIPDRSIEFGLKKYRRYKTGRRDKLESYVEKVVENFIVQRGEFPTLQYIEKLVSEYMNIPLNKDGKLPRRTRDKLKKALHRVKERYRRRRWKEKRQEALDGLEIAYNQYLEYGKEDKDILYSGYKNALPYLTKEEKEKWKKILMEEGLPVWIL